MRAALEFSQITFSNRLLRFVWSVVWITLFRPSPRLLHGWRCMLLRLFGARLGRKVHIYPSAKIWAPWNLIMEDGSGVGEYVDLYSVDEIKIGKGAAVSQYAFLCTASHDYTKLDLPLITAPIVIGEYAWVTSDVFIAPGITIGDGAVILARSTVLQDVDAWTVVSGNPAVFRKLRIIDKGVE